MNPLNNILNRINSWNEPEVGVFKKVIGSRVTNLLRTIPTEIIAIAQNILLTPVFAATTVFKTGVKVVSLLTGSEEVKQFEKSIPGFTAMLHSIARIVAYAIGTLLTATLGVVISPKANFNAHCAIGIAYDIRKEAFKNAFGKKEIEETLAKIIAEKEAQAKAAQDRANELKELNNLATAYSIANEAQQEAEETKTTIENNFAPFYDEILSDHKTMTLPAASQITSRLTHEDHYPNIRSLASRSADKIREEAEEAKHLASLGAKKVKYGAEDFADNVSHKAHRAKNEAEYLASEGARKVKHGAEDFADNVSHGVHRAKNEAEYLASEGARKVRFAVDDAEDAVSHGAHKVKRGAENLVHDAKSKASHVAHKVEQEGEEIIDDVKSAASKGANMVVEGGKELLHKVKVGGEKILHGTQHVAEKGVHRAEEKGKEIYQDTRLGAHKIAHLVEEREEAAANEIKLDAYKAKHRAVENGEEIIYGAETAASKVANALLHPLNFLGNVYNAAANKFA